MMSDYHSYLITSLDLHSVDLEEFKYGGTNITALRLVDPEKPELQKVVRNWVYGELRYGRKLDLPPPRDNLTFIKVSVSGGHHGYATCCIICISKEAEFRLKSVLIRIKHSCTPIREIKCVLHISVTKINLYT
ncbi:Glutamate receptor, ionotropic kainate 3 [Zootermopsis nevadensis]|uniref:Glutamate receptor, ionotropic kainate 3 n=1 Tax=Zootermopsis nevadensis TaxID=136037 RepID=A0A067QJL7_ZOONE|nr:Glutamate receptor, ionotropic kainate 3 [Zootermopsis nevadensis]